MLVHWSTHPEEVKKKKGLIPYIRHDNAIYLTFYLSTGTGENTQNELKYRNYRNTD